MARRAVKSADAFRTISEVADDLEVPQHVLRFWETKFTQVRPMKRAGGRRYYRPEDVDLLRRIRELLYRDGYTIRGAQKLLRAGGTRDGEEVSETPANDVTVAKSNADAAVNDDLRRELEAVVQELRAISDILRSIKP